MKSMSWARMPLIAVAAAVCLTAVSPALAQSRVLPPGPGLLNVKRDFGAKGDGITDDTAAIQAAIDSTHNPYVPYGRAFGWENVLYFPNGTYLVSKTLNARHPYVTFQGQSRTGTVLKLRDNCPGFNREAASSRAVIYEVGTGNANNTNFDNYLFDLTVNTGRQNPKAQAVQFICSNEGAIRNVTLTSGDGQGDVGLWLVGEVGPGYAKNVTVNGFDTGIRIEGLTDSFTLEHVTLTNQLQRGLLMADQVVNVRDLKTGEPAGVPAVVNNGSGVLTLLEGVLKGGSGQTAAIVNNGQAFVRGLSAADSHYSAVISGGIGKTLSEYHQNPVSAVFPGSGSSLNLPIRETPAITDDPLSDWVSVLDHGAGDRNRGIDSTEGIRKAIAAADAAGKTTLYFPPLQYNVSGDLTLPSGSLKRVIGFGSAVFDVSAQKNATFHVRNAAQDVVVQSFAAFPLISQETARALTVMDAGAGITQGAGAVGPLYIEDVCGGLTSHGSVWARQLNPEGTSVDVLNHGGRLWVLGLKTEQPVTHVLTDGGGKTEILGSLWYPAQGNVPADTPAFISTDSQTSLTMAVTSFGTQPYHTLVRETRGGITKSLVDTGKFPRHGNGGPIVTLYTSAPRAK